LLPLADFAQSFDPDFVVKTKRGHVHILGAGHGASSIVVGLPVYRRAREPVRVLDQASHQWPSGAHVAPCRQFPREEGPGPGPVMVTVDPLQEQVM
jgi:hypothetical protein